MLKKFNRPYTVHSDILKQTGIFRYIFPFSQRLLVGVINYICIHIYMQPTQFPRSLSTTKDICSRLGGVCIYTIYL